MPRGLASGFCLGVLPRGFAPGFCLGVSRQGTIGNWLDGLWLELLALTIAGSTLIEPQPQEPEKRGTDPAFYVVVPWCTALSSRSSLIKSQGNSGSCWTFSAVFDATTGPHGFLYISTILYT